MIVFPDVEIEFFDINEELPEHHEEVLIVTKDAARWSKSISELTFCVTHIYKKAPPRFAEIGENGFKNYKKEHIKCWGRLITK